MRAYASSNGNTGFSVGCLGLLIIWPFIGTYILFVKLPIEIIRALATVFQRP